MQQSISISSDKEMLDIGYIHHYLSTQSYWAKGRTMDDVKTSIEQSFCFGVYLNVQQVGFARVITDCSVFAYIADVFIDKNYRGKGLSKLLMKEILSYRQFKAVKQWTLKTLDAHGLYAQFGFSPPAEPARILERWL